MRWVRVHTAQGDGEAITIRSMLEAHGIPVKEAKESAGRLYAIQVDGLGKVELLVPEDRAEEAAGLIETPAESE